MAQRLRLQLAVITEVIQENREEMNRRDKDYFNVFINN